MKKLQRIMAASFFLGFISLLLFTVGLLSWNWYGVGLYSFESDLLLAWIIVMFGTAGFYGILIAILYPEELRQRFASRKWHRF